MPTASTSSSTTEESDMAEYAAIRNKDRCPSHPGQVLREDVLPATGVSKIAIARMLAPNPVFTNFISLSPNANV